MNHLIAVGAAKRRDTEDRAIRLCIGRLSGTRGCYVLLRGVGLMGMDVSGSAPQVLSL